MDNERAQELINKSIDKSITDQEKIELEKFLEVNADAKKQFTELCKSMAIISKLPNYEPSDNVKKNILNTIENAINEDKKKVIQQSVFAGKNKFRFSPKVGFSIAFGAVVVFFVFLLFNTSRKEINVNKDISGFMGKSETPIDASSIYYTDLIAIQSSLNIYQKKDTLMVLMNKKSSDNISIGYHFDPDYVSFIGARESKQVMPAVSHIDGKASVTIQDPSKVLMLFKVIKPTSTMDLQIRDSVRQIFRYKFTVGLKK